MVERLKLSVGCNDGETGQFHVYVNGVYETTIQAQCCKNLGTDCSSDLEIYPRAANSISVKMNNGGGWDGLLSIKSMKIYYR